MIDPFIIAYAFIDVKYENVHFTYTLHNLYTVLLTFLK